MPNYKVTKATIQAAKELLGAADHLNVHQVDEIVLREVDANAEPDKLRKVAFIPLGGVLGIVTFKVNVDSESDASYKDEDIVFVSMRAFANIIPALGFYYTRDVVGLVPPKGVNE